MTDFVVTKRYRVPTKQINKNCRVVDTEKLNHFWRTSDNVADKRGCYIFSMKAAKGELPFYVGKAAKQSFKQECFTPHKRADHYDIILNSRKGTPYICFVVQQKTRGKWSLTAIDEVEEYLIAHAATRNKALSNQRRLPTQSWAIRGVASSGQGKPSTEARAFRTLLGIK
jgi:hypothetical protein